MTLMNGKEPTLAEKELTVERKLAADLRELIGRTMLPLEKQAAILMVASVMVVGEMPGVSDRRGKVINAMVDEMRKRLQLFLPL